MDERRFARPYLLALLFVGLISAWGCPKKSEVASAPETSPPAESQKEAVKQPVPATPETTRQGSTAESREAKERSATAENTLQPVYFDFDQALIRSDAKEIMKANAAWLKAHPNVKIKIEGNADERGTIEYNQALGQRRARSAKRYLTDMGVTGARISLISYGKEKPVCSESTEICWQKNRRADFVSLN